MKPQICSVCDEEVRLGWRHGVYGWLHREDVDHFPVFGHIRTPEEAEHARRMMEEVEHIGEDGEPYITRERDIMKDPNADRRKRRLAEFREEDPDYVAPLPEPELRRTPIEVDDLPPRSGMRQVANLVVKTDGWELRRLTKARGPYLGADGSVLSISDSIVLGAQRLDADRSFAVASWRDGKFDSAYIGSKGSARLVNATELKAWIKQ